MRFLFLGPKVFGAKIDSSPDLLVFDATFIFSVAHATDVVIRFAKKVARFFCRGSQTKKEKLFFLLLLLLATTTATTTDYYYCYYYYYYYYYYYCYYYLLLLVITYF